MRLHREIFVSAIAVMSGLSAVVHANDSFVRAYSSPRVTAMGGLFVTTGMWDDNFYGNPARIAHNPWFKMRVIDVPMIETTLPTILAVPTILANSTNPLAAIGSQAGSPLQMRIQTAFPSVFIPARNGRIWGLHFGLTSSTEISGLLRESYTLTTRTNGEVAGHLGFAIKFLPREMLTLGINARFAYRFSANPTLSLVDYFQGAVPNLFAQMGDGAMVDGDVGAIFRLPWQPGGVYDIDIAATLNQVLGGEYRNIPLSLVGTGIAPFSQPRALGVGVSIRRPLWGFFKDSVAALEVHDLGNPAGGSFFRMLHLGAETRWRFLIARAGINQGYLTAGLGVYFRFFTLDFTTYGEEFALNAGGLESRRFAFRAGFQIVN